MKLYKVALFVTMLLLLLSGCKNRQEPAQPAPTFPVQEVTSTPAPSESVQTDEPTPTAPPSLPITTAISSPMPTPSAGNTTPAKVTPTPTPVETPIDYNEIRQKESIEGTVEGFYHRPYEELPQELRDSLEWDGQVRTQQGYRFRLRRYTGPNIVVTTTEATDEALRDWLDWQLGLPADDEAREGSEEELRTEYEREKGREWLYSVTITDDSYTTLLGLKVGNTVDEAESLGYPLRQRLNTDGEATFGDTWEHSLRIRVEDAVVKELYLTWGIGRYTGKYWDL